MLTGVPVLMVPPLNAGLQPRNRLLNGGSVTRLLSPPNRPAPAKPGEQYGSLTTAREVVFTTIGPGTATSIAGATGATGVWVTNGATLGWAAPKPPLASTRSGSR